MYTIDDPTQMFVARCMNGGIEMSHLSTKDARGQFSDVISRAAFAKERTVLTRHGKAVAAVVPIEDFEFLEKIADRIDLEDARAALADVKRRGTVSWKKIKLELGL